MGKREVHVVPVPKWATVILLVLVSAAMAALIYVLSGRAYANASHPIRDLIVRMLRAGSVPRPTLLAVLMPVFANVLLFVPWGFLTFVALDSPDRPRRTSYVLTVLSGVVFAALINAWQYTLPTRVTTPADSIANGCGALAGAVLGHLRKMVRVRFEY